MSQLVLLKFGGSTLRGPSDIVRAVHAIYAEVRKGHRVIAVTSAFFGRTDQLEASLETLDAERGARSSARVRAALLATGEVETANLLAAALDRSGVPARVADVREFGPFVEPGSEAPTSFDTRRFLQLFEDRTLQDRGRDPIHEPGAAVICLPGFAAVESTEDRAPALLGRGGSDMTAVFVGHATGARITLVKDVEGLYTSDPSKQQPTGAQPRRLASVTFDDALTLGPHILQPRAVAEAKACGTHFDVVGPGALAGVRGTLVGADRTLVRSKPLAPPPLRVALLGLGTVGARVFAELSSAPDRFEVTSILVSSRSARSRPVAAEPLLTESFDEVLAGAPDLVIEALVGEQPAADFMRRALGAGIHVVTANKVAASTAQPALDDTARAAGAAFLSSATVGGSLPALEAVRRSILDRTDTLIKIEGVLNGTSNAVLGWLEAGDSLQAAIARAQAAGLAEADPSMDLDGTDVAHKLTLLSRAAGWGTPRIELQEGIDGETASNIRGDAAPERAKLVGSIEPGAATIEVREVRPGDPFHGVDGAWNVLRLVFASGRTEIIRGRGAGAWPTATAVLGDAYEIARRVALRNGPRASRGDQR